MEINKIYEGSSLDVLRSFPGGVIDMCITSPPYYGLRDYGVAGQVGLESTVGMYLDNLVSIFTEVGRVLKDEGSLWVNLGDSYSGGGKGKENKGNDVVKYPPRVTTDIPSKSLMLIPERFAIRMVDSGWILRNVIIWYKPSCLPESVKDRFTRDFEYLYFFTKQKRYYFDQQFEPLRDPYRASRRYFNPDNVDRKQNYYSENRKVGVGINPLTAESSRLKSLENGRNKRCVWKIPAKPYKGAHFATFPPLLIEPPIRAGCPEGGVVLDPFMGAGTTALVSKRLGRNYVGIELNPEYIKMSECRIGAVQQDLF